MEKIDYGVMRKPLMIFDTDSMDIGRRQTITNPDGTEGESDPLTPLYSNVPCHISFKQIDNPDTDSVDTNPIISVLLINCDLSVDIQNNDYITARKLDANGNVLETYVGSIGYPQVTQSRKTAEMIMRTNI